MKYVLSKEDLIRFKNMSVYMLTSDDTCKTSTEKAVDKFLKSKTPVEEIADGELEGSWLYEKHSSISKENFGEYLFEKYQCKNIKIYIEVSPKRTRIPFKDVWLSIENSPDKKEVI